MRNTHVRGTLPSAFAKLDQRRSHHTFMSNALDVGSLCEGCNNQISDAIDVYAIDKASELDPSHVTSAHVGGSSLPTPSGPRGVHPLRMPTR